MKGPKPWSCLPEPSRTHLGFPSLLIWPSGTSCEAMTARVGNQKAALCYLQAQHPNQCYLLLVLWVDQVSHIPKQTRLTDKVFLCTRIKWDHHDFSHPLSPSFSQPQQSLCSIPSPFPDLWAPLPSSRAWPKGSPLPRSRGSGMGRSWRPVTTSS